MKKIVAVLMLCLVAGCLGGYSPASRFYNLQALKAGEVTAISDKTLDVGVDDVVLPDYLDRPQIMVFENDSPQMRTAESDRWGDSLAAMIQRTVVDDLAAYLPQSKIKAKVELAEKFGLLVEVQVVKMDFVWNKEAVFEAWWSVNDTKGKAVARQRFYATQKVGENFDEFVKAESDMIKSMSLDIAKALIKAKK